MTAESLTDVVAADSDAAGPPAPPAAAGDAVGAADLAAEGAAAADGTGLGAVSVVIPSLARSHRWSYLALQVRQVDVAKLPCASISLSSVMPAARSRVSCRADRD